MKESSVLVSLLIFSLAVVEQASGAETLRYHVATNGRDTWSGKLPKPNRAQSDGPFATLERARDEIRKMKKEGRIPKGGVIVEVHRGTYEIQQPLVLNEEDSGVAGAPVIYRAAKGEEVRLVGGKIVTGWKPVTAPSARERLDASARDKVIQADLRALGISDYGDVVASGRRLELFYRDRPMTVARWPNEGFTRIVDVVGGVPHKIHGIPGDKVGRFTYDGDRPQRWVGEKDAWLHGYWFWDWSDQRQQIESIDTTHRVIAVKPPYHGYGYRKGQWYYGFNLLSELDKPEEWYLDRETGLLYFWPPDSLQYQSPTGKQMPGGRAVVSVVPNLITMKDVSHVTVQRMILEASRGTAITLTGGKCVEIVGCTIRNTGAWAVQINGGERCGVIGCDIYETGNGGISLSGGDRKTLTPCGHYAENNHIHHYSRWDRVYQPGITLNGVGCRASHNLIDNAPHMAMGFGGNDHLIEFNEIHSVTYESNDAGAIYTGRNWTMRGTVIRHNFLHHINGFEGRGCVGVYLDDQFCGTEIYGNVFYKVTRAAMIGGGRDCTIENNIFVDCVPATHVDARGLGWAAGGEAGLRNHLQELPYKESPWKDRYPRLATILDEDPMAPRGNVIARNICVGGRWGDFEARAKPLVRFEDNLIDEDPRFRGGQKPADAWPLRNFQLREDSPAYKVGFKVIPVEKIGLYKDARRASWPVVSKVRELPTPPPTPKRAARTGPPPIFNVARLASPPQIDGVIHPDEWNGADVAKAMVIEQGIHGEKVSPRSLAWLGWDDTCLYIAIDNSVNPKFPIRPGNQWGQDDAVEVAVRNTAASKDAPIMVLRGYPSGCFESSDEAGAPGQTVRRAAEEVKYEAKILQANRWTAEWRIPFASLGIDPLKHRRFAFNLSARKTADELWVEWQGTGGCTWEVDNAGVVVLTP